MPKKHDMIRIDAIGVGVCLFVSLAVYLAWGHPFLRQRTLQIKQRSALAAQRQECSRLTEFVGRPWRGNWRSSKENWPRVDSTSSPSIELTSGLPC